jgi:sugar transferase (PEP-CTERM/EpsH1 system associated)
VTDLTYTRGYAALRILFLTPRFPYPPLKGDTLRAYHQIRALSEQGHTVTLLSLGTPSNLGDREEMERWCVRVLCVPLSQNRARLNMGLGLFSTMPLQVSHYKSAEFRRLLEQTLAQDNFDAIHVALIRMLPYVWKLDASRIPIVVDLIDSLTLNLEDRRQTLKGPLRVAFEMEYRRVRNYERRVVQRFQALAVSSPADKEALGGRSNISVVPNGVDLNRFPFHAGADRDAETLIFTGNMGYGPNEEAVVWFVDEVWPLLRQERPNVTFQVVGTNPGERVRSLANRAGVQVLGGVPDVGEYLGRATAAVAPMRSGSGIQNKVLEAMSAGAPIVATSIANRGVGAMPERDLLVADTPQRFAQAVASLLDNPQKQSELAQAGRAYVEQHFQWEEHARRLAPMYEAGSARLRSNTSRLNVMQMTDVTGRGGAEKALADIALNLDRQRYNVTVCATRSAGNYQPLLDEAGIKTFVQGRRSRWDVGQWWKLVRLLRSERVDILHTHLFGSNSLGRLLGRLGGVPVVIAHEHWSTISPRQAQIDRLLYRLSSRIIVPSEASKQLVMQTEKIPAGAISVLYNGVDTSRYMPPSTEAHAEARREFGIEDGDLLVGVVGRLSPEKGGVDNLIRATHRLREQHKNVRLLIVGDGPFRAGLEKLDAELHEANSGRASPIIFAGARQDIPRLLGAMDMFVLPSLNEALPIVILEAMAARLPVVATRVGGVPEIVQDGATGLLVAPGDEVELLAALNRLAEDKALRARLADAGREQVRARFTIEQMVRNLEIIYEELLTGMATSKDGADMAGRLRVVDHRS